jgi:hypothetical protein
MQNIQACGNSQRIVYITELLETYFIIFRVGPRLKCEQTRSQISESPNSSDV